MALRLHVAAHHAEAHFALAIFCHECGNDGMKWPLAGWPGSRSNTLSATQPDRSPAARIAGLPASTMLAALAPSQFGLKAYRLG